MAELLHTYLPHLQPGCKVTQNTNHTMHLLGRPPVVLPSCSYSLHAALHPDPNADKQHTKINTQKN